MLLWSTLLKSRGAEPVEAGTVRRKKRVLVVLLYAPAVAACCLLGCGDIRERKPTSVEAAPSAAKVETPPLQPTAWPDKSIEQLGNVTASLSTRWFEDRLYYQFSIGAGSRQIRDARGRSERRIGNMRILSPPALIVHMLDEDGFNLLEIRLSIPGLFSVVDYAGHEIELVANDSAACSAERYRRIKGWSIAWQL